MNRIVTLIFIIILTSCNKSIPKRFLPERMFSEENIPIATAIYNGDRDAMRGFISKGIDLNKPDKDGMTYLVYAVLIENYKMTELLLENGADANLVAPYMRTSINDFRKEEEKVPYNMLPLEAACGSRHDIKLMKLLVEHGANVNDGRAPLPLGKAAMSGDKKKIKYLLQCGADINKKDYNGNTIIISLTMASDLDMVEFLWDMGADPTIAETDRGYTVAYWMQHDYIDRNRMSPKAKRIIERLKSIGVVFPATKQKPTQQPENKQSQQTDSTKQDNSSCAK